ncbi:protein NRT1/ PTR FAMILY 7.3-like [Coffea arabica]|uniref:Protein NRT1/ PTR FAMILY 7.3-like n=1 Tax=Coffea arabica TaxID=13443 RepID=A0ABM4WWA4_COFAR
MQDARNRLPNTCTKDGSFDRHGKPAIKEKTGGWRSGMLLLVNEGLAAVAFTGVEVNMVLFAKSVLRQSNADAANTFSRWMGTLNICALIGAFLSDSYMGRYVTCVVFQTIMVLGLIILTLSTRIFMIEPKGCGRIGEHCDIKSPLETAIFYISIYLVALGSGGMEPALGTFGADQFDEEDTEEKRSKTAFFGYYYVALNLGSLIAETVLVYIENLGMWELAFWISTSGGFFALILLLCGNSRYRHFKPAGNPVSRFFQVFVASTRKMKLEVPSNGKGLHELQEKDEKDSTRNIVHTDDFKFLDRAAFVTAPDVITILPGKSQAPNPWRLCTVSQVEEVKCVLRLLPIWFCTIVASIVFVQVLSLFVEQGAAMESVILGFHIPPASMTAFDIISTSTFIICYEKFIVPFYVKLTKRKPKTLSELQRIGIGLVISIVAMIIAGFVELHRLRHAIQKGQETSSLSIFWQTPQYVLVGVAEAFVIVAQWEFFASQTPDRLKSLGLGLSMSSSALGSYLCSIALTVVMNITSRHGKPGWVPANLNDGHLDRFFFLSAALIALDLAMFVVVAKRYKCITLEKREGGAEAGAIP